MRCNYVHAMCYLGEIYAVLSKTATRKHKMKLAALCKKLQFEAASFKTELPASFWNFQIELLATQNAKLELPALKQSF